MTDCPDAMLAHVPTRDHLGLVVWGVLFAIVAGYELWATRTGRQTLSQTVQHGPRWFKVTLGMGFCVLLWHLFL